MTYMPIIKDILSTKRNAMFLFAFLGLKIIEFKNCFNSVVLPSSKDLLKLHNFVINWIPCSV